jgi:phthiocerol/phenolphthiocerol synthesis type-I polyketide synthase E
LARLQLPERRADGRPDVPIVGSVRHPVDATPDLDVLLGGLGRLWLAGVPVDWAALNNGAPRTRVPLPTYPFERRRFWVDGRTDASELVPGRDGHDPAARGSSATCGRYGRPNLATPYAAPRTELEEIVAGLWQDVLGLADIGVNDDFFELGGHSLLAIQLLGRLRDGFGLDLPMRIIFEAPTIAALSDTIEERLVEQIESLSDDEADRLVPASIP